MKEKRIKKIYTPLLVEVLEVRLPGEVVCASGGRNDYEEEDW